MQTAESRETLLAGLRATSAELARLMGELDDAEWHRRPAPGEWSPTEIACHLRDVEREVHRPRLERVAAQADAFIPAADTDPLALARDYQAQDGRAALAAFLAERRALLDYLAGVPAHVWQRTARHALFGTTTFSELVALMLEHDRAHVQQVRAALEGG